MRKSLAGAMVSEEGGGEVLQVLEPKFPYGLWCGPWRRRLSLCSPWRTTVKQGSMLQPVEETTVEQVDLH